MSRVGILRSDTILNPVVIVWVLTINKFLDLDESKQDNSIILSWKTWKQFGLIQRERFFWLPLLRWYTKEPEKNKSCFTEFVLHLFELLFKTFCIALFAYWGIGRLFCRLKFRTKHHRSPVLQIFQATFKMDEFSYQSRQWGSYWASSKVFHEEIHRFIQKRSTTLDRITCDIIKMR